MEANQIGEIMKQTDKQAIIVADMFATAIIKAEMYFGRGRASFDRDFAAELDEYNHDGELDEIYNALFKHLIDRREKVERLTNK